MTLTPMPEEVAQARSNPGGWVYRVAGAFGADDAVPPEAIIGAWKVDERGDITGAFVPNERYDPGRWPAVGENG